MAQFDETYVQSVERSLQLITRALVAHADQHGTGDFKAAVTDLRALWPEGELRPDGPTADESADEEPPSTEADAAPVDPTADQHASTPDEEPPTEADASTLPDSNPATEPPPRAAGWPDQLTG